MSTPLWCLVIVALLPYTLALAGGYFRQRQFGAIDNNDPRLQYTRLSGAGARVWAAQLNAWEALALFTAAVVVATLAHADPGRAASASMVFLVARLLHPLFYVANLAPLRSLAAVIGMACCVYMFVLAVRA